MSGKFSVLIISTKFILLPNMTNQSVQSESSSSRRAKEKKSFWWPSQFNEDVTTESDSLTILKVDSLMAVYNRWTELVYCSPKMRSSSYAITVLWCLFGPGSVCLMLQYASQSCSFVIQQPTLCSLCYVANM